MNLWQKLRGVVGSPDGRGILTGQDSPGCCCGPQTCDCNTNADCSVPTSIFGCTGGKLQNSDPNTGQIAVYNQNDQCSGCCGPTQGQRLRRYTIETVYVTVGPCAGSVTDIEESWDTYNGGPTYTHRDRSQTVAVACGPLITTDTSQEIGIPDGFCNFVGFDYSTNPTGIPGLPGFSPPAGSDVASGWWRSTPTVFEAHYEWQDNPGLRGVIDYRWYLDPNSSACQDPVCHIACCLPGGFCREDLTETLCRGMGGVPRGTGVRCAEAGCDGSDPHNHGACCDPVTGDCVQTSEVTCEAPRIFKGLGTPCTPNPCPQPTGSCCHGPNNISCSITTQAQCTAINGVWHGAATICSNNTCTGPQACCLGDGSGGCVSLSPLDCVAQGGFPQGAGTDCLFTPCVGACCVATSHGATCSVEGQVACQSQGGIWYGPGSSCTPFPCGSNPGQTGSGGAL